MQIPPSGSYIPSASEALSTEQTQRVGGKPDDAKPVVEKKSSFAPTTDLTQLLAAVKQLPDVRADVVQSVTARAAAGELTTTAAAQDTAAAALDDLR